MDADYPFDFAESLLKASLQAAIDVLGSTATTEICRAYLTPVETLVTVRRVTVTGACVASSSQGDVFLPAAVADGDQGALVVGARLNVSMIQTRTGRSAYLALTAEENKDEDWQTVPTKRAVMKGRNDDHRYENNGKGKNSGGKGCGGGSGKGSGGKGVKKDGGGGKSDERCLRK